MQASPMVSLSSSFTRDSNTNLAEIAARVVEEFRVENETESKFFFNYNETFNSLEDGQILNEKELEKNKQNEDKDENYAADDDFEFVFVTSTGSDQFSPISADEIFDNGQIRPIFNRPLLLNDVKFKDETCCNLDKVSITPKSIRVPLKKLFIEEREIATSCSSSEADDLEAIPPETYCVWRPRAAEESPTERCKKSNSTGSSSKRWKLRDLLHRSNSDGKETFVYLTTPFRKKEEKLEKPRTDSAKITGKVTGVPVGALLEDRK